MASSMEIETKYPDQEHSNTNGFSNGYRSSGSAASAPKPRSSAGRARGHVFDEMIAAQTASLDPVALIAAQKQKRKLLEAKQAEEATLNPSTASSPAPAPSPPASSILVEAHPGLFLPFSVPHSIVSAESTQALRAQVERFFEQEIDPRRTQSPQAYAAEPLLARYASSVATANGRITPNNTAAQFTMNDRSESINLLTSAVFEHLNSQSRSKPNDVTPTSIPAERFLFSFYTAPQLRFTPHHSQSVIQSHPISASVSSTLFNREHHRESVPVLPISTSDRNISSAAYTLSESSHRFSLFSVPPTALLAPQPASSDPPLLPPAQQAAGSATLSVPSGADSLRVSGSVSVAPLSSTIPENGDGQGEAGEAADVVGPPAKRASSLLAKEPNYPVDFTRNSVTDEEVVVLERLRREKELNVGIDRTKKKNIHIDTALLARTGSGEPLPIKAADVKALKRGKEWMKKRRREIKRNNKYFEMTCDMMLGIRTMVEHTALTMTAAAKMQRDHAASLPIGNAKGSDQDTRPFDPSEILAVPKPVNLKDGSEQEGALPPHYTHAPTLRLSANGGELTPGTPLTSSFRRPRRQTLPAFTNFASREMTPEDFKSSFKLEFPTDGSDVTPPHPHRTFEFKDYAGPVFAKLRAFFGIREDEYLHSLAGGLPYLDFISNSKSGMFFFFTYDRRYMIKSQPKEESRFFRSLLPKYYEFVTAQPNTLLTRIFGIHRIALKGREVHFMIMGNVFHCAKPLHLRFDLKGSTVGRAATDREKQQKVPVLKDLDFKDLYLELGDKKANLQQQIERDTKFLEDLDIMDYSLLVGIHYKNKSDIPQQFRLHPVRDAKGGTGSGGDDHTDDEDVDLDDDVLNEPSQLPTGASPQLQARRTPVGSQRKSMAGADTVPEEAGGINTKPANSLLAAFSPPTPGSQRRQAPSSVGLPSSAVTTLTPRHSRQSSLVPPRTPSQGARGDAKEWSERKDADDEADDDDGASIDAQDVELSDIKQQDRSHLMTYYGFKEHERPVLNTKVRNPKVASFLHRLSLSGMQPIESGTTADLDPEDLEAEYGSAPPPRGRAHSYLSSANAPQGLGLGSVPERDRTLPNSSSWPSAEPNSGSPIRVSVVSPMASQPPSAGPASSEPSNATPAPAPPPSAPLHHKTSSLLTQGHAVRDSELSAPRLSLPRLSLGLNASDAAELQAAMTAATADDRSPGRAPADRSSVASLEPGAAPSEASAPPPLSVPGTPPLTPSGRASLISPQFGDGQKGHARNRSRNLGGMFRTEDGGIHSVGEDGKVGEVVYYLGIIDILQRYNRRKQAEHVLKSVFNDSKSISAVEPHLYAKRFREFIFSHLK